MSEFQALVPTRSDGPGVVRVAQECLASSEVDLEVLVSISDPCHQQEISVLLQTLGDERVRILPSAGDLSLYSNFRRLVDAATAPWVSICADDDSKPPGLVAECLDQGDANSLLLVPPIEVRRFHRATQSFGDVLEFIAATPRDGSMAQQAGMVPPGWVFGVWRREWLHHIYPRSDFDWLDCSVVQRTLYAGGLTWVDATEPLICGLNPSRAPWAVNASGFHSTADWKRYCRESFAPTDPFGRLSWYWNVERLYDKVAKKLNASVAHG